MKKILKLLQKPGVKILLSPLASILFGFVIAYNPSQKTPWVSIIVLSLLMIGLQMIEHFLHVKYHRKNHAASPDFILYGLGIFCLILFGLYWIVNGWKLSLIVATYAAFIFALYYHPLSLGFYDGLFRTFFQGFMLNAVAYVTLSGAITWQNLLAILPLTLMHLVVNFQVNAYRQEMSGIRRPNVNLPAMINFVLLAIATLAAAYCSLPTKSYYLVQLLYLAINSFLAIPVLVKVKVGQQLQNKSNYLQSLLFIQSLLYALAYRY